MPTVSAPASRASSHTIGAAPVPVPPPMPQVMNTRSALVSARATSSRFSSIAWRPISGRAPAPSPRVSFLPIWILTSDFELSRAWASVLTEMNSTPSRCSSIIRLTALPAAAADAHHLHAGVLRRALLEFEDHGERSSTASDLGTADRTSSTQLRGNITPFSRRRVLHVCLHEIGTHHVIRLIHTCDTPISFLRRLRCTQASTATRDVIHDRLRPRTRSSDYGSLTRALCPRRATSATRYCSRACPPWRSKRSPAATSRTRSIHLSTPGATSRGRLPSRRRRRPAPFGGPHICANPTTVANRGASTESLSPPILSAGEPTRTPMPNDIGRQVAHTRHARPRRPSTPRPRSAGARNPPR